ncbi:MAG: fibronectin type III domain-containing protein [Candidatus Schekmanbacteria bacterium]|nr:fibronectin type III domain-containing protein [Candidatus Schekmanbacteria bacterium]
MTTMNRKQLSAAMMWITVFAAPAGAEDSLASRGSETTPLLYSPAATDTVSPVWPEESRLEALGVAWEDVTLRWTAATDESGVTAYRIYQNTTLRDTVGGDVRGYAASRLSERTNYRFRVEAGDTAGNWSSTGPSATVRTEPADKESPKLLESRLEILDVTGTTARFRWGAGTDDVGLVTYRIEGATRVLAETDGTTLEATATGLRPGRYYKVNLVAYDQAGNASNDGPNGAFMAIDPGVPAPPEWVTISPPNFFKGIEDELGVGWGDSTTPGAVRYRLYRRLPGESTPTLIGEFPPRTSHYDRGLDPAQTYYYSVSAVDSGGAEGPRSVEASLIPMESYWQVPGPGKMERKVRISVARIMQGEDPREELERNEYQIRTAPDGFPLVLEFTGPARDEWFDELESIGLEVGERGGESCTVLYDYDRLVEQLKAVEALPFVRRQMALPSGYSPGSMSPTSAAGAASMELVREITGIEPLRKAGIDGSAIPIGFIDWGFSPGTHGFTAIAVMKELLSLNQVTTCQPKPSERLNVCIGQLASKKVIVVPMTFLDQPAPQMDEAITALAGDVHVVFAAGNNARLAYAADAFNPVVKAGRTTHGFGTATGNWEITLDSAYDPRDELVVYLFWNRPDLDLGVVLFEDDCPRAGSESHEDMPIGEQWYPWARAGWTPSKRLPGSCLSNRYDAGVFLHKVPANVDLSSLRFRLVVLVKDEGLLTVTPRTSSHSILGWAAHPDVMAIGASEDDLIADYSGRGPGMIMAANGFQELEKPAFVAPGHVKNAAGATFRGTSAAAPVAAALVAIHLDQYQRRHGKLPARSQTESALEALSTRIDSTCGGCEGNSYAHTYGAGRIKIAWLESQQCTGPGCTSPGGRLLPVDECRRAVGAASKGSWPPRRRRSAVRRTASFCRATGSPPKRCPTGRGTRCPGDWKIRL